MKKGLLRKIILLMTMTVLVTGTFTACGGKTEGKLVVGLDDAFPPMGYRDDNNKIVGFDIDMAKEVCKRLNLEMVPTPIKWEAKDMELKSGNIDCIWNGFTINGREKDYLFTSPYMNNNQVMVVKKDSKLANEKDFAGKKIALQEDSSAVAALNDNAAFKSSLKEVVKYDTNQKALLDLSIGQVDGVLMDEIVARYNIEKLDGKYKVLDFSLAQEQYGVGFKLGNTAMRDKVENTLQAMAKDGTATKISNKWFGKDLVTLGK